MWERQGNERRGAYTGASASTSGSSGSARTAAASAGAASTGGCATSARTAAALASASTGGSATAARSVAAAASASTGGCAAGARTAAARGPLRMRRRRQRLRLRLWPHWRAYIASVSSVQRSRSGVTLLVLNHAFSRHTKRWAKAQRARGTATGGGPPVLGWFVILMGPGIIPEPGDTATLADK